MFKIRKKLRKEIWEAKRSFYEKNISMLKTSDPRLWHSEIRRMAQNGGKRKEMGLPDVPGYEGATDHEMAEEYATQLFKLTEDYSLINAEDVRQKCLPFRPELLVHGDVVRAIQSMKIPRGLHPLDPPREIIKPLANLFAVPLLNIYNKCLRESVWPKTWKSELTHLLPKKKVVEKLKDLRPIALTQVWSKLFESIIRKWILTDIQPNFSHKQYGGVAGRGVSEYMMTMTHEILQASQKKKIALLLAFDFSSAFNCLEHSKVVEAAEQLGVRRSLLPLLASYLDTRTNVVRWGKALSRPMHCRGGSGQGTLLSVLLFLITVDPLIKRLDSAITNIEGAEQSASSVMAYVDDLSLIVTLDPELCPVENNVRIWKGGGHVQSYLDILSDFSSNTGMRLNKQKNSCPVLCLWAGTGVS